MKLSVFERLLLRNILPKQGNLVTMRVLHKLHERLGFSEEELERLDIRQEGTKVEWRKEAEEPVEIDIGPTARKIILDSFAGLDEAEKLTVEHVAVYERFLEEGKLQEVSSG